MSGQHSEDPPGHGPFPGSGIGIGFVKSRCLNIIIQDLLYYKPKITTMKNLKATVLAGLLVLSTGIMFSQSRQNINPVGTWTFTAPDAPVDYSRGDFVIIQDGEELKGELVFSEYYKIPVQELKLVADTLTFRAYVEGTVIYSTNIITHDTIKGRVSTSEGIIEFSARRKEE